MPILRKIAAPTPGQPDIDLERFKNSTLDMGFISEEDALNDPQPLDFGLPIRSRTVTVSIPCELNGYSITIGFTGTVNQLNGLTAELKGMGFAPICQHR